MLECFLADRVQLHCGDCLDVLAQLDDNSIDSCVTDPPYHLVSIVKRFGADDAAPVKVSEFYKENGESKGSSPYLRGSRGFMGKQWDGGDIAFRPEVWTAVYRVLKPGAHLLAMGGTRTYHRLVCAIEDAGFEIRDCIQWLYGSGFPKSHDVSKGIDRAAGVEREKIRTLMGPTGNKYCKGLGDGRPWMEQAAAAGFHEHDGNEPITDAARQWEGWGTALKPAMELICLARKPLSEKTVAANVLKWGTGAINIDKCRVEFASDADRESAKLRGRATGKPLSNLAGVTDERAPFIPSDNTKGRWPANLIHDGSDEVVAAFPESEGAVGACHDPNGSFGYHGGANGRYIEGTKDSGSAARFFYTAKADSDDRIGSKHPTIKPLDLMQYLVRLITPKGGTVLDPFAGTGTTGEAAWREGMRAVLIEWEAEYQIDIRRRMALAFAGPDERARESIKAKNLPRDDGPLFQWQAPPDEYDATDDFSRSIEDCYAAIRERKAQGGKGWGD